MHSLPVKIAPGGDLRLSIENIARDSRKSGFVLGVVGNLSRACFQCPGKTKPTILEGNLEIITLNGTFSPDSVHLHLSFSDGDCQVWGGHLELGTNVLKGADVLMGFFDEKHVPLHSDSDISKQEDPRIEIAIIPGCPWSSRALRILRSLEVPYKLQVIESDDSFHVLENRTGIATFPQLFVDGDFIGGYESLEELHSSGKLVQLR